MISDNRSCPDRVYDKSSNPNEIGYLTLVSYPNRVSDNSSCPTKVYDNSFCPDRVSDNSFYTDRISENRFFHLSNV